MSFNGWHASSVSLANRTAALGMPISTRATRLSSKRLKKSCVVCAATTKWCKEADLYFCRGCGDERVPPRNIKGVKSIHLGVGLDPHASESAEFRPEPIENLQNKAQAQIRLEKIPSFFLCCTVTTSLPEVRTVGRRICWREK